MTRPKPRWGHSLPSPRSTQGSGPNRSWPDRKPTKRSAAVLGALFLSWALFVLLISLVSSTKSDSAASALILVALFVLCLPFGVGLILQRRRSDATTKPRNHLWLIPTFLCFTLVAV